METLNMDKLYSLLDVALAHTQRLSGKHLYAGKLQTPLAGKTYPVASPATRKQIGTAADGDAQDVAAAVGAAVHAQSDWAAMSPRARGKILQKAAAQLTQHTEEIAALLALETGKAIRTRSEEHTSELQSLMRHSYA